MIGRTIVSTVSEQQEVKMKPKPRGTLGRIQLSRNTNGDQNE